MDNEIAHLQSLSEEYELGITRLSNAPESGESIDLLKRELISIEGQIDYSTDCLYSCIRRDDRISSDKRQEQLEAILNQLSINLDQLRVKRRTTYNAAKEALKKSNEETLSQKRQRLLGDQSQDEILSTMRQKNINSATLATDITSRLERTRELISNQIQASEQSLQIMEESTGELQGINDAAARAGIAQAAASRSILKLRIAQNWDRYLFNASRIIFFIAVFYVIYRKLTFNIFSRFIFFIIKSFYRLILKVFHMHGTSSEAQPLNDTSQDL